MFGELPSTFGRVWKRAAKMLKDYHGAHEIVVFVKGIEDPIAFITREDVTRREWVEAFVKFTKK